MWVFRGPVLELKKEDKERAGYNFPPGGGYETARGADSFYAGDVMRQFFVFVIGIAATLTVYFLLNAVVRNIEGDRERKSVSTIQRVVLERVSAMEQSIRTASAMISHVPVQDEGALASSLRYAVPVLDRFDRLVFAYESESGWKSYDLLISPQGEAGGIPEISAMMRGQEKSLYSYIDDRKSHEQGNVVAAIDMPGMGYYQEQAEPVIRGRPFVLGRAFVYNGRPAVLAGVSRIARLLNPEILGDLDEIKRIAVQDMGSGLPVYYMSRVLSGEDDMDQGGQRQEVVFPVGNQTWVMQMKTGGGDAMAALSSIPLMSLLMGVVVTFAGTLLSRAGQRRNFRIESMSRTLAQKNFEMNSYAADRERLNQALMKKEKEYRALIDAVNDIIFETTVQGKISFLNDAWVRITGFEIEQSMDRDIFGLIHPQDQEEQRLNFAQMVAGKRGGYHFFTRLRTTSGSFRAVEMSVSMVRQDGSKNLRVVGTITDIEERRRAEKALGEAEKKFRAIVENAAGGIYQVTPEGQYLSANPAMAGILGYESPEHMLREVKNAHEDIYADGRERAQFIQKLDTLGMVRNFETQIFTKDGQKIWISENARAIRDEDGNVLYYEGSIENISKRKEIEIKLREAKVQSDLSSRAKSEFLANMSHELRTPLNAIIGFSEIIKNEVLGPLSSGQYKEYVRDIHDSGKRLLTIINEILDVSRIETGQRSLNEGVVELSRISKSCISFVRPKAEQGGLTLINLMDGKAPKLIGEELAIKQILLNLLSNAVKYTGEGGRVTLSHEIDHDGQLRISVTDTGIGLDEAEIKKALSPFGQVETAFNRAGSGAGLGLTLVDSLMKLHGGRLELFSKKGVGTTATVVFPARRVAQDQKDETPDDDDGGENAGKGGGSGKQDTTRSIQ